MISANEKIELLQAAHQRGLPLVLNLAPSAKKNSWRDQSTEQILVALSIQARSWEWRILEAIGSFLHEKWRSLNPCYINSLLLENPNSAVWGVFAEWILLLGDKVSAAEKAFWTISIDGILPAPTQLFFSEPRITSNQESSKYILWNHPLYEKWGFVCKDLPSSGPWKGLDFELPEIIRKRVLTELIKRGPFEISDYLAAVDNRISRQTAWRDLKSRVEIISVGTTKGTRYKSRLSK